MSLSSINVATVIKAYVDNGGLPSPLDCDNVPKFPCVKFVSYVEGTLRLIVAGDCPNCTAPWICNICNIDFCNCVRGQ